jgi:hypothetical protein
MLDCGAHQPDSLHGASHLRGWDHNGKGDYRQRGMRASAGVKVQWAARGLWL